MSLRPKIGGVSSAHAVMSMDKQCQGVAAEQKRAKQPEQCLSSHKSNETVSIPNPKVEGYCLCCNLFLGEVNESSAAPPLIVPFKWTKALSLSSSISH